ncbi:MAG: permease [Candidatus Micrarchaeota archaeon]
MEKNERNFLIGIVGLFLLFYFMPSGERWFDNAILSGTTMLHEYAILHILTCLVPAFFIAGALNTFVQKSTILKNLSSKANKLNAYAIASVSGAVLAVCSCTILPLFAGIHKRGAGLGPATTFLFSGPAINIAAIFLTFSVLGFDIGIARAVSAIVLAILVGISMDFIFREKQDKGALILDKEQKIITSKTTVGALMVFMVGILIVNGLQIESFLKISAMVLLALVVGGMSWLWVDKKERASWLGQTWDFAKTLMPVLFIGVFIAGFAIEIIPQDLVKEIAGENTLVANAFASVFGAFMYFSTLTEIPILQALIASGMHRGPALALLLAGPSLSLPNLLVIRQVLGNTKTLAYLVLVILFSTVAGFLFGMVA